MKRFTHIKTIFVAFDGKEFYSEVECKEHEAKLKERKKKEEKQLEMLTKLQMVDVSNNDFIRQQVINAFDFDYKAFKFIYHSDYSLMDVLSIYNDDDEKSYGKCDSLYTIIDNIEKRVILNDFPQLEDGETYLFVYYHDLGGDYRNIPDQHLMKLSDYKEYYLKQINEI